VQDLEHMGGLYLPLPSEEYPSSLPYSTTRPLLLHAGRGHYTSLVTVDEVTTRIPLFTVDSDPGGGNLRVTPLPLRFFARGGDAWRGFTRAWVTEPNGRDVLEPYVGSITEEVLPSGERVHYLNLDQYTRNEPPPLAARLAEVYLANLQRRFQEAEVAAADAANEVSPVERWYYSLPEWHQAMLISVELGPATHTEEEMRAWLEENLESLDQEYRDKITTPQAGAQPRSPIFDIDEAAEDQSAAAVAVAAATGGAPAEMEGVAPMDVESSGDAPELRAQEGFFGGGRPECS
jgi:hypothetical protein